MPLPKPLPNETQPDFAIRFHEAVARDIPNTDERNDACFAAWDEANPDEALIVQAKSQFPDSEFAFVPCVPIFAEHVATNQDGTPLPYGRDELRKMVDGNNERIADTGGFSPITDGHTPSREAMDKGAKMPDVLGYTGPYKLGMIGAKTPRWAIFASEWHHRSDRQKLSKMRRRSPEVWLHSDPSMRVIDPVAALGAETPRLDMGLVRCCRASGGQLVMKYSAADPSAASVFTPGLAGKKSQYGESQMALSPEDVKQVVDELMKTDLMQKVASIVGGGSPTPSATPDTPVDPDIDAPAEPAPAADSAPPPKPPYEPDDEDKAMMSRYAAGEVEDEELAQYMAGKKAQYMAADQAKAMWTKADEAGKRYRDKKTGESFYEDMDGEWPTKKHSRNSAMNDRVETAKLSRELEDTRKRLAKIEQEKTASERYSRLSDLRSDGYVIDMEKEQARVASMDDKAFTNHLEVIVENYSRIPLANNVRIHAPNDGVPRQRMNRNSEPTAEQAEKATKYCLAQRAKGTEVSFSEALEHVCKSA